KDCKRSSAGPTPAPPRKPTGFFWWENYSGALAGNHSSILPRARSTRKSRWGGGRFGATTPGTTKAPCTPRRPRLACFLRAGPNVPQDERASRSARAEMAAGFAAKGLRHHEEALGHFREMGRWAELEAGSSNSDLRENGTTMQRWALGCTGGELEALGHTN